MHQLQFKSKEHYVNWRRQWRENYRKTTYSIRSFKKVTRDMNLSEVERRLAGKSLNSFKQMARTMMMGLDASKAYYEMTHKVMPPKRTKIKPTEEEINARILAKWGPKEIGCEVEKQTITN